MSDTLEPTDSLRPAGMALAEWRARLELAACYRLFDYLGWAEGIYNHLTLRVDGGSADCPHYLINPFGLHYTEVTARNLVKIDARGDKVGDSDGFVNPAGVVIHSAVHAARPDAHCVMHTHTTAGMAVACKRDGLRYDNFYGALVFGEVAYHDFEGVTTDDHECARLVESLGKRRLLILRNHGLIAVGSDVAHTYAWLWMLQRACEVQAATDAMAGDNVAIDEAVLRGNAAKSQRMSAQIDPHRMMFDAMLRRAGIRYSALV
ncbi:MAG: class II aldolase/adducin family protein [Burkholderiaceae bacterium]